MALEFVIDATAGTVGSIAGIVIGAPFDLVKTRLQYGESKGALHVIGQVMRHEGPAAFFKGSLVAALGQAPNNFLVFGCFGSSLRALNRHTYGHEDVDRSTNLRNVYLAGSWAGLVQSAALSPFEHIKVQQQVMKSRTRLGMRECASAIWQTSGFRRGIMRGWIATAWRDSPTFGGYFCTYELLKKRLTERYEWARASPPPHAAGHSHPKESNAVLLVSGGAAGLVSWMFAMPLDVIKTRIQASPLTTPKADVRMGAVARQLFAEGGVPAFFRGIVPCLIRSMPVNAVTLLVYEQVLEALQPGGDFHEEIMHER